MIKSLSVIVPAYNEEKRLLKSMSKIISFIKELKIPTELILVDDGSTDKTAEIARKAGAKVISYKPNKGKGNAVRTGVFAAKNEWVLFMDADLSTPLNMYPRLAQHYKNDFIIGSRNMKDSDIQLERGWFRKLLGKGFPLITRILLLPGIKDTQCGYKLMRTKEAKKVFKLSRINGFGFDAEILFIAKKNGYSIKEVPVVWKNDAASKVHPIKDTWRMFWNVVGIRINNIKGKY
ncbi:MAG: dolichyl-phosphate beta-glucosyltransferase [Candidatus Woesearchaeota archaeon]